MDLALLWAGILAFAILAYVVLDGFDLGLGILFPILGDEEGRNAAMNSIAPVWDGNETWLVLGGGGLFAVFPLAYAILMPAVYAPIIVMLLALVFRGVAFEFRFKSLRRRRLWDGSFFFGSLVATFAQGVVLGTLVQGIEVEGRAYAGGWYAWITPFSMATGAALVVGYALLGATWLMMRTDGRLFETARRHAFWTGILTLLAIGGVSLWMPFIQDSFFMRWFAWPSFLYVAPVPVLTAIVAAGLFASLAASRRVLPFLCALGFFVLGFIGLAISFFPMIIPPSVTIYDAAAPESSLFFLLVGASVLIPAILLYTAFAYWTFRGPVKADEGYH